MILLEQLYRLLAADDQTRPLDPIFEVRVVTAAAAVVEDAFTCPERHAALITHVLAKFVPAPGQNVALDSHVRVQRGDATQLVRLKDLAAAGAAGVNIVFDWQGEAILQPGGEVRISGTFNAGALPNSVVLHVHGMLIPLGTIQRT